MPALSLTADTLHLFSFDDVSAGTGYATLVDSIATGGVARNLTEVNGGAGARSPNYTHIINAGAKAGRYARRFPGKATTGAAYLTRAGDAASAAALTGSYTWRKWVIPETLGQGEMFALTGPSESPGDNCLLQVAVLGSGFIQLFWEFSSGTNVTMTQNTGVAMVAGGWYHLAITVDNSGGTSTVKLYINGTLQQTFSGITKATGGTTATWFLGCSGPSPAAAFRGAVTGLCIDTVVRTGVEIAAYAALTNYTHPTDGSTFVAWHCQEPPDLVNKSAFGVHLRAVGTIESVDPLIPGSTGKARHLNGTTEYIGPDQDTATRTALAGDWTWQGWFRGDVGWNNFDAYIWSFGEWLTELQADNSVSIDITTARIMRLSMESGSGADTLITTSSPVFAAVGDGFAKTFFSVVKTTAAGTTTMKVYKNGALAFTSSAAGNFDGAGSGGTNSYLRIGGYPGATLHDLAAVVDDFRWVTRELTPAEILADFAGPPVVFTLPIVASTEIGRDIYIDETTRRWGRTKNGDIARTSGVGAVVQAVRQAVRMHLGEWFLDTSKGVDWFGVILGQKDPDIAAIRAILRVTLLGVVGVRDVVSVSIDLDNVARAFSIVASVTTDLGEFVVINQVVAPNG